MDMRAEIQTTVEETLKILGHNAEDARDKIAEFMKDIEQDLAAALESGDKLSLELLRDQLAGRLARVSLQLIYRERQAILVAIVTTIRILTTVL